MKEILSKDITGFKVSVIITDNNKLAVRLDNSDGEFVGQLFSSLDNIADLFTRVSSGELLTDNELEMIKREYNQALGIESLTKIGQLRMESLEFKSGTLKSDLTIGGKTLNKGTKVDYRVDNDMLFIKGYSQFLKLDNRVKESDVIA